MDGAEILTVEGYDVDPVLKTLQMSNWYEDAAQCGNCIPGFIMAATALLKRNPNPSVDEIRYGLSGNLCRCGTYYNQIKAVQRAARTLRGV
jgi:carbon-monoxide dehydrogenase small subunit